MDDILNKLSEELNLRYNENTVNSFLGFVKISPDILSKLEKDFNSGLSHCIEILEHVKRIKV